MMAEVRGNQHHARQINSLLQHPLWASLLCYRKYLVLSFFGYAIYSMGVVLLADLMQYLLDALAQGGQSSRSLLARALAALGLQAAVPTIDSARIVVPLSLLVLVALRGLGYFGGNYCLSAASRNLMHDLRLRYFQVLLTAPCGYFDENTAGAVVSRLTFTVEQVAGAVTGALRTLLREGLVVAALLSYLLYLNWMLCLILIAITPVVALIVSKVATLFRHHSERIQASMGDLAHVAQENISGHKDIRLFGAQTQQAARFNSASDYNRQQGIRLALIDALSTPMVQSVLALAIAVLVWVALHPAVIGTLSAGALIAFLVAAVQIGKPVRQLTAVQAELQRGLVAADDLYSQFGRAGESDTGVIDSLAIHGRLTFSALSFRYPQEDRFALQEIDLNIESGETVALVGASGAGKSTLISVLTRMHNPPRNTVFLDDTPVESFRLRYLREQFALVSQHPMLFDGTVRENLLLGYSGSVADSALLDVLNSAAALEFVQEMGGLDAHIGAAGDGLSGGQRQRLAIARALLRDAPILILDEATSALDYALEHRVHNALLRLIAHKTTLIIAHRLSTIEHADRIVVLQQGKVRESGTHQALLQARGLYAQFYNRDFPPDA